MSENNKSWKTQTSTCRETKRPRRRGVPPEKDIIRFGRGSGLFIGESYQCRSFPLGRSKRNAQINTGGNA